MYNILLKINDHTKIINTPIRLKKTHHVHSFKTNQFHPCKTYDSVCCINKKHKYNVIYFIM